VAGDGAQGASQGPRAPYDGPPLESMSTAPTSRVGQRRGGRRGICSGERRVGRGLPRASREQGRRRMAEIDGRRGVSGEEAAAELAWRRPGVVRASREERGSVGLV
jgi:hypothetical protein